MIFSGPLPPKPLHDSMPYSVLSPSAFAPGWAPWMDAGCGSFLALARTVDGPSYQHLALPTVVRLRGPVPRQGGHCLYRGCVQLLAGQDRGQACSTRPI